MSIVDALNAAGFKPEKSSIGGFKPLEGVYKASLVEVVKMEDKGYGESIYAQFKISECLTGAESNSKFPEFKDYYSLHPDKVASKRNGLAKLINGLFSVGIEVDTGSDDALIASLEQAKGGEVFIKAYSQARRKQNEAGEWVTDEDKDPKQGFTFLTEANAMKEVKKAGSPF